MGPGGATFTCFFAHGSGGVLVADFAQKKNSVIWLVLSDEQMSKGWPFFLLNVEQMSNWLGVEHQPVIFLAA